MTAMTSHYVDITVVPDAETGIPALMGALYDKLHRALVQLRLDSLGISFPQYSVTPRNIGHTLRLHASEATLQSFLSHDWLRSLRDHVRITPIAPTPVHAVHRNIHRRQFKSSVNRLRRRRMNRKMETAKQASQAIPHEAAEKPTLPYVHLHSLSTSQPFYLFIAMSEPLTTPIPGCFNSYGLGTHGATVPWF